MTHDTQQYWCPIGNDWTDPPRLKRGSKSKTKTHVLHEGKALCGKASPAWFHWPDEVPTCEECLKQMIQS
jgi:hypothetical protein